MIRGLLAVDSVISCTTNHHLRDKQGEDRDGFIEQERRVNEIGMTDRDQMI